MKSSESASWGTMTKEEVKILRVHISAMSQYFGHPLSDEVIKMYADDLADLDHEEVMKTLQKIRRDPKTSRFPLPSLIRAKIDPQDSPEGLAREIAAKMIGAVSKYGWNNTERAKEYIGPIGWKLIGHLGGWEEFNRIVSYENITTLQAQIREMLTPLMTKGIQSGSLQIENNSEGIGELTKFEINMPLFPK